jgi:hypothetical protein
LCSIELGEYTLPDGWAIVAAGTRDSDRAVTTRTPTPLRNRFVHLEFEVDLQEWSEWAIQTGIRPEVMAFLRFGRSCSVAESIKASLRVGTRELWQRWYKVVSHMSARMTEYNAAQDGSKPRLYDSMITNIVEIVDVLPKLNIAGDTELDRMASEIRKALVVDPKELRKSETMRSDAAKAAADIVQQMAAYMGVPAITEVA